MRTTVMISLRLPRDLLAQLRREAWAMRVPYQTYIKAILISRLPKELKRKRLTVSR